MDEILNDTATAPYTLILMHALFLRVYNFATIKISMRSWHKYMAGDVDVDVDVVVVIVVVFVIFFNLHCYFVFHRIIFLAVL